MCIMSTSVVVTILERLGLAATPLAVRVSALAPEIAALVLKNGWPKSRAEYQNLKQQDGNWVVAVGAERFGAFECGAGTGTSSPSPADT